MTSAAPVICAGCSAVVREPHGPTAVCAACGVELLLSPSSLSEQGILPRLDAAQAKAAFERLFHNDGEPRPGPYALESRLLFVPFYQLTGNLVGVAADGRAVHRWAEAHIAAIDDHDDLGLDAVDADRADDDDGDAARGIDELQGLGVVLQSERLRDEVEPFLADAVRIPADGDAPTLVDRRLRLIYYPLWRLRFVDRELTYQATIDGMTGTVLHARVPAKQRRRAFLGVVASACLGFILGVMLRHPGLGVPALTRAIEDAGIGTLLPSLTLFGIGVTLYILLLNAAWNALRYANELVYHHGLKTRVLINRREETALDRFTAWVKRRWSVLFRERRYDQ